MTERGIFNQGPFFVRPGFIRGLIIIVLIGLFIFLFLGEILQVIDMVWEPSITIGDDYLQGLIILLWNGFLFFGCFFIVLMLVSLYILPVQTGQHRKRVFNRLIAYLTKQHGPAVFIKGGKEIAKKSELLSSKPGVAFVDLTSAIALEKQSPRKSSLTSLNISDSGNSSPSPFSQTQRFQQSSLRGGKKTAVRIAGPGITFTETGETIRGVIDLRPQVRTRRDVHAYTREGIEIRTSITTMFTVGQKPEIIKVIYDGDENPENLRIVLLSEKFINNDGETGSVSELIIKDLIDGLDFADRQEIHRYISDYRKTGGEVRYQTIISKEDPSAPFLFDPTRIFKAIYASSLDIREDNYKKWTDLPPYIATEIFRNLIAGQVYDNLYFPTDHSKFPIQDLKSNFALKMRHQGVLAFQFFERKDSIPYEIGQEWFENSYIRYPIQELYNPKVLRARGIKVIHASFSELTPVNPGIREQLLDNWGAYWDNEAEYSRMEHELAKTRIINNARIKTQINLKDQLLNLLGSSSVVDDALALRLLQALEAVAADAKTQQLLPGETISMLRSIWRWFSTDDQYSQLGSIAGDENSSIVSIDPIDDDQNVRDADTEELLDEEIPNSDVDETNLDEDNDLDITN